MLVVDRARRCQVLKFLADMPTDLVYVCIGLAKRQFYPVVEDVGRQVKRGRHMFASLIAHG